MVNKKRELTDSVTTMEIPGRRITLKSGVNEKQQLNPGGPSNRQESQVPNK